VVKRVIQAKGGLHNRLTRRMRLLPFNLGETQQFLTYRGVRLDAMQVAQIYMAIGGIPHYLNHIKPGKSAAQNIDALCFRATGMLCDEYEALLPALFEVDSMHQEIVKALATSWQGLSREELIAKTRLPSGGRLTQAIEDLVLSGFVLPVTAWNKKTKETIFRLIDEFSIFYWSWMQPARIDTKWMHIAAGKRYESWTGYAFENICIKHMQQIKRSLGISGMEASVGTWRHRGDQTNAGAQIDILIDRADRCFNIVEAKFSEKPYVISKVYAAELRSKIDVFRTATKSSRPIFLTMVAPQGIEPNSNSIGLSIESLRIEDLM
jgi:uncharacterized protein